MFEQSPARLLCLHIGRCLLFLLICLGLSTQDTAYFLFLLGILPGKSLFLFTLLLFEDTSPLLGLLALNLHRLTVCLGSSSILFLAILFLLLALTVGNTGAFECL